MSLALQEEEGGSERGEAADDCGGVSRQDRIRFQVTLEEGEGDEEREEEEDELAAACGSRGSDADPSGDLSGDLSGDPTSAAGM